MVSSSQIVPHGDNEVQSGPGALEFVRDMLRDKVYEILGDPSEPCSPQAYLQTVIEQMLAGERVRDFMCDEARTMEKADVEARLHQIFDESFGESVHQLSKFYNQRITFTNTLMFTNVLSVYDKLRSGALSDEEYDREIRITVNFQLGRAGIEFAHAATGRDIEKASHRH